MKYQNIIWDWNGTIVDDVGIALDAVNAMLEQKGYPLIDIQQYRKAMDTPIIKFYECFFDMNDTSFDWIADFFNKYYAEHQNNLKLHKGVETLLEEFWHKEYNQIVLSSSSTRIIEKFAGYFSVAGYFNSILGADNLLAGSKVYRAVEYMKQNHLDSDKTILIGDSVHDYEVAQAIGVDCILVACGHQDREALEQCGCEVCDTTAQCGRFIYD